jgi:hypothetical protein
MAQKLLDFFYSNGHLVHLEPLFATISMSVGMHNNNSTSNDVMHVCGSINYFQKKSLVKRLRNLIV